MGYRERLTDDGFETFEATAEGILRFVATTRPEPPRSDVIAHARSLVREGKLSAADVEVLEAAGYQELSAATELDAVERAMREISEERPDLVEAPAGHRTLGDLDDDRDAAYWRAVDERAARIRAGSACGSAAPRLREPRPGRREGYVRAGGDRTL